MDAWRAAQRRDEQRVARARPLLAEPSTGICPRTSGARSTRAPSTTASTTAGPRCWPRSRRPEPGEQAGEQAEALREHLGACVSEDIVELTPRIHAQLVDALEVLEDPEVLLAYGARDIWELIDTLARLELGTVPEVSRVRTMAASGSAIIAWLTDETSIVSEEVVDAAQTWLETAAAPPET